MSQIRLPRLHSLLTLTLSLFQCVFACFTLILFTITLAHAHACKFLGLQENYLLDFINTLINYLLLDTHACKFIRLQETYVHACKILRLQEN